MPKSVKFEATRLGKSYLLPLKTTSSFQRNEPNSPLMMLSIERHVGDRNPI